MLNVLVRVAISDPWDFGSEHGMEALKATIVGTAGDSRVVLLLNEPFAHKGKLTSHLVADSRHEGLAFDHLEDGGPVPANFLPMSPDEGGATIEAIGRTAGAWRGWVLVGAVQLALTL